MHVIGESATVKAGSIGVIQPTFSQIRTNEDTLRNGRTFDYTVDSFQVQWGKRFANCAAGATFNFAKAEIIQKAASVIIHIIYKAIKSKNL